MSCFVLDCEPDGSIAAILHDKLGLDAEWIGRPFTALIEPSNLPRALDFFRNIGVQGAQYLWDLPVAQLGRSLVFVGARFHDRILIAATATKADFDTLITDMVRINNEQANTIRGLIKEQTRPSLGRDEELWNELTRLNTEFANLQRELARKNMELAQANDRKSLLLGMAAHDLRNPLTAISGFAEYLEGMMVDEPRMLRFVQHIRQSSDFMRGLIEDLIEVSRSEAGRLVLEREAVDLSELVDEVVALNAPIAERKGIALHTNAGAVMPPAYELDRGKMIQVLNNLIGNAIKFSPAGTRVTVGLEVGPDGVRLSVADQGPGIPAAEIDKLFLPFSKLSPRPTDGEASTGLGLSISKNIVEGHGGQITVASPPGHGATFTILLPA